jgi:hypothetical protein
MTLRRTMPPYFPVLFYPGTFFVVFLHPSSPNAEGPYAVHAFYPPLTHFARLVLTIIAWGHGVSQLGICIFKLADVLDGPCTSTGHQSTLVIANVLDNDPC